MASETKPSPSFSPFRKWRIGIHVVLVTFLVLAVMVMVNYLSRDFFIRLHLGNATVKELSPATVKLVESVTNNVKITIYFDRSDPLYNLVTSLLKEYKLLNQKITVETVDYLLDSAAAQRVKAQYHLNAPTDKDLVIFDCNGKYKVVDAKGLGEYLLQQVPSEKGLQFQSKATHFKGEEIFSSMLLNVISLKPLKAYFLTGHGEHDLKSGDEVDGYQKFAEVLYQNYVAPTNLSLLGTNQVPMDCSLLVIAGPKTAISESELEKIDQYLTQGGRLLAMFSAYTANKETGLEKILAKFGVDVGRNMIKDPERTPSGSDLVVSDFGKHSIVNPLLQSALYMIQPRSIARTSAKSPGAYATKVQEIAFTSSRAYAAGDPRREPHRFPLMAVVDAGDLRGVVTERGTTRMVITGDSIFLANHPIDSADNRAFARYALNWLLDQTQLLPGLGPRPIIEYRVLMTQRQMQEAQWILLAAMPLAILVLGGVVWLRRRR